MMADSGDESGLKRKMAEMSIVTDSNLPSTSSMETPSKRRCSGTADHSGLDPTTFCLEKSEVYQKLVLIP